MKFKTLLNGAVLFIGLGLAAYSQLNGYRLRFNVESVPVDSSTEDRELHPKNGRLKKAQSTTVTPLDTHQSLNFLT